MDVRALLVTITLSLPALAQNDPAKPPAEAPAKPKAAEAESADRAAKKKEAEQAKRMFDVLLQADAAPKLVEQARLEALTLRIKDAQLRARAALQAAHPNARQRVVLLNDAVRLRRIINGQPTPTSPLLHGDYAEAMAALDAARSKMLTAADPEAAFAALEAATKALMDARAALWRQQEAAKRDAPEPAPAKPDKRDDG